MQSDQLYALPTAWILANALSVLTALIVLIVGWTAARILSSRAGRLLERSRAIDGTLRPLIILTLRYTILAITLIIVLGQFGVQTASILAVLGAAGLALALALQGTLSNMAAGIMLLWLRPFNVGEYIDAEGTGGTVVEIGLFGTRLRSYDGIYTFAPNSKLWNARIVNYSREATRMVEIKVGIAYTSSIATARDVLLELAKDERVLEAPAPTVFVGDLGQSSVQMVLRVWVAGANFWATKIDFVERTKLELDAAGIEIPYNKLDVTLTHANAPNPEGKNGTATGNPTAT